jgi:hypothetical protein
MAAGDVADRIGHGHDAQAERQRHADQADTDLRKTGSDDRAAASRKSEPKRADRFGGIFFGIHTRLPHVLRYWMLGRPREGLVI